jgi:glycosyltransferase involved in cell wall biosynthesis
LNPIYVNGRFLSQGLSGVQRVCISLVRALDQLISQEPSHPLAGRVVLVVPRNVEARLPLTEISIRSFGMLTGHAWEQFELPWVTKDGILVSLAGGVPVLKKHQLYLLHDAAVFATPHAYSLSYRIWHTTLLRLARRRVSFATVSDFSREEISRHLHLASAEIPVIRNAACTLLNHRGDDRTLEQLGLHPGRFVLAFGSSNPNKNTESVLKVASSGSLRARGIVVALVSGTASKIFSRHITKSAFSNIVEVSGVEDSTLSLLYRHAICLLFPSTYEGFGLPPLEAMANSCPSIVANYGAAREVCGDAAVYVSPFDIDLMVDQVISLYEDGDRRAHLSRIGLARAATFSWKDSARRLVEVVLRLEAAVH